MRATWRRIDDFIWAADYNGSSWSDFYQWMSGYDPTLSANVSGTQAAKMVFRSGGSAPYTLTTTSENLAKALPPEVVHHRRGVLTLGEAEVAFELGEFELAGSPVRLFRYVDTLAVGHTGDWQEMFRTESFRVSDQADLSYSRIFEIANRDQLADRLPANARVGFQLEVVEAPTRQVLAAPDSQSVTRNLPADSRDRRSLVFDLNGTKEIFLRVGLKLPATSCDKTKSIDVQDADTGQTSRGAHQH